MMKRFLPTLMTLTALILLASCSKSEGQGNSPSGTEESSATTTVVNYQPGPKAESHKITVNIKNFDQPKVYLAYHQGKKKYYQDSTEFVNGQAVFQGDEALLPGIYMVLMPPENRYFEFIVNPSDQEFSLTVDSEEMMESMTFEGSEENDIFYQELRFFREKRKQMTFAETRATDVVKVKPDSAKIYEQQAEQIRNEIQSYRTNLHKEHPDLLYPALLMMVEEPVYKVPASAKTRQDTLNYFYDYRSTYMANMDFSVEGLARTPFLAPRVNTLLNKMTPQTPDSLYPQVKMVLDKALKGDPEIFKFLTIQLVNRYSNPKVMGLDEIYTRISDDYYKPGHAFWIDEDELNEFVDDADLRKHTLIGKTAADLNMQDRNGQFQKLSALQAKWTILYFWDYDCPHCQVVTPKLVRMYQKFKNRDVGLYAVSLNGDIEVWKQRLQNKYLMEGPKVVHVQDHRHATGFHRYYDIRNTPVVFLLDENKKILAKSISIETLENMLNQYLAGKDPMQRQ